MTHGPRHFPSRQQEKRSKEIFAAAMIVARRGHPFGALDVHFTLTGMPIKPCGKSGNPTPGISRCLKVMIDDGYIVKVKSKRRPRTYAIVADPPVPARSATAVQEKYHSFITEPTREMLMQGKARPARSRQISP